MLTKDLVWWVSSNKVRLLIGLAFLMLLLFVAGIAFVPVNQAPMKGRELLWKQELGQDSWTGEIWQILPSNDWSVVYVITHSNSLYCFDISGNQQWIISVPVTGVGSGSLVLSSTDAVLVAGENGAVLYSKEGKLLWNFDLDSSPENDLHAAPPGEAAEFVVWNDEYLMGLSPDGDVTWVTDKYQPQLYGKPLYRGSSGMFYLTQRNDCVIALDPNGTERWRHKLKFGFTGLNGIQEIDDFVLISDFFYAPKCGQSDDAFIYCLDNSGELRWEIHADIFGSDIRDLSGKKVERSFNWDNLLLDSIDGELRIMLFFDWLDPPLEINKKGEIERQYQLPNDVWTIPTGNPKGLVLEIHPPGDTLALAQWDILK